MQASCIWEQYEKPRGPVQCVRNVTPPPPQPGFLVSHLLLVLAACKGNPADRGMHRGAHPLGKLTHVEDPWE